MSEEHDGDAPRLTVPKFSSFKKKQHTDVPTDASSHESGQKPRDIAEHHRRDRHRSKRPRHEDTSQPGEGHARRDRSKYSQRESKSHPRVPASQRPAELEQPRHPHISSSNGGDGQEGVYTIDTKGDPLLRKYGNNVHYYVPSTFRYPPGRVLGAEGRLYIHRDGTREQFSILQPGERVDSSRQVDVLRSRWPRAHPNPTRLKSQKVHAEDDDADVSFLQIGKPKKRTRALSSDSESSNSGQDLGYRSIEGKMKVKPASEDDESEEDLDVAIDIHQDNPLRWLSVQLNRRVKEHPEDIDAWLELVAHQDTLKNAGHSIDQSLLEDEMRSYTEIKVSMLESALSHTKSRHDRTRVLVLLMKEGSTVWDWKTAARKWADLSVEERQNFELWKTYLDFQLSDVASFQYEDLKSLLISRLKYLLTGESTVESTQARIEEAIYVFTRLTRMIADAGYRELALSAWQALFELNFCRPATHDSANSSLESFQEFWESEVPRFGEAGSQGWRHFVESNGTDEPPEPGAAPINGDDPKSRDPYKLWAASEEKRGRDGRVPARTLDEGNDDDPFRVVMFTDIEQMVFFVPPDILKSVAGQLLDSFLLHSGLPTAVDSNSWTALASRDPHIVVEAGALQNDKIGTQSLLDDDDISRRSPLFRGRMLACSLVLDVLLPGQGWFQYLPTPNPNGSVPWELVGRVVKQVEHLGWVDRLAEYLLAFTQSFDPKSTRKQAKALLKQHPTSIALYVAYALAEYSNGKDDVVQTTLASAADMSSGRDLASVIRSWAWVELQRQKKSASLRVLCSMTDPQLRKMADDATSIPSSQVIKASQLYESEVYTALSAGSSEAVALYGECALLLSYLTSTDSKEPSSSAQGGIEAAMEMVHRLSGELGRRSMQHSSGHEQLLQAAARILYWHASNGPFRRTYMREHLTTFAGIFPKNTIFLSLLEWSDSGLRVIDETRQLLQEKSLTPAEDCLSSRVFAIQHEIEHGNVNSARAAFENAVASDACRASPVIWRWYIQYSFTHRSLRSKAKEIFYRAISHCPWSKEVMMQAFTTLIRVMESDELKAVYETMSSKGLRIHVELDDFLREHELKRSRERRGR